MNHHWFPKLKRVYESRECQKNIVTLLFLPLPWNMELTSGDFGKPCHKFRLTIWVFRHGMVNIKYNQCTFCFDTHPDSDKILQDDNAPKNSANGFHNCQEVMCMRTHGLAPTFTLSKFDRIWILHIATARQEKPSYSSATVIRFYLAMAHFN